MTNLRGRLTLLAVTSICWLHAPRLTRGSETLYSQTPRETARREAPSSEELGAMKLGAPVSSSEAVITIHGVCKEGTPVSSCTSVVTKDEFEALLNAVNIGGEPIGLDARRRFAQAYTESLVFEQAARRAGIENSEQFARILRWLRSRTLADIYRHSIQSRYRVPTPSEIDAYYKQNLSSYQTVRLARIFIPREYFSITDKAGFERKAQEAAIAARERIVKGDDPEQIQKDAYAALGIAAPPPTDMGTSRRTQFVPHEGDEVFSLNPGEVSLVETEPKSYVVYKVISKDTLGENQVKDEISREVSRQNIKAAIQAIVDSAPAKLNEQYFGSIGSSSPPPKSSAQPHAIEQRPN
jgi:hypothetical protein